MEALIPIIAIIGIFGIPLSAIWTSHRRQVLEMQLRLQNQGDANVRAAIDDLRQEIKSLRDTTMQYDLSFDSALQRMERRVEALENRAVGVNADSANDLRIGR
ncbi:MAG TPA: hypothetical protein VFB21_02330 [Chthonomonadaceae bacterium]|nr:hypothetical protein [Chthonomonadaceae bacterium]